MHRKARQIVWCETVLTAPPSSYCIWNPVLVFLVISPKFNTKIRSTGFQSWKSSQSLIQGNLDTAPLCCWGKRGLTSPHPEADPFSPAALPVPSSLSSALAAHRRPAPPGLPLWSQSESNSSLQWSRNSKELILLTLFHTQQPQGLHFWYLLKSLILKLPGIIYQSNVGLERHRVSELCGLICCLRSCNLKDTEHLLFLILF